MIGADKRDGELGAQSAHARAEERVARGFIGRPIICRTCCFFMIFDHGYQRGFFFIFFISK